MPSFLASSSWWLVSTLHMIGSLFVPFLPTVFNLALMPHVEIFASNLIPNNNSFFFLLQLVNLYCLQSRYQHNSAIIWREPIFSKMEYGNGKCEVRADHWTLGARTLRWVLKISWLHLYSIKMCKELKDVKWFIQHDGLKVAPNCLSLSTYSPPHLILSFSFVLTQ